MSADIAHKTKFTLIEVTLKRKKKKKHEMAMIHIQDNVLVIF